MIVSCLGPKESYSALAAKKLCPNAERLYCTSFTGTLNSLLEGKSDAAILPVENCIMGSVVQSLDLISKAQGIFGVDEYVLRIEHRLVTKGHIPYDQIQRVCSHAQALNQCSDFIGRNFPHAKLVFASSTADSLNLLDEHTAGIVGAHVKDMAEGLVLSEENIADEKNNFTRFLLFVRGNEPPAHSGFVYCSAVCLQEPGSLCRLLEVFNKYGVNLTSLESRPIRNVIGKYRFFIEFEGDIGSDTVKKMLKEAEKMCEQFRLLGAYGSL